MLKKDFRKLAMDRAVTRYPKGVITVLLKLTDLTRLPDWKTDHLENFFSYPTTESKLAFLTNLSRWTVSRSLKALTRDGVIKASARQKDSYSINPEALKMFDSKYLKNRTVGLEQKVLNTIRMGFARNPDKTPEWATLHPEQCECVPHFCSHPSAS